MTDTQTPDSLRPGDMVGPWRVEGYAGRGSYGAVYRARQADHPDSPPVALKVAVFPSDPRFNREVELLSRNVHPGIPRLLGRGWWHASAEVAHPYFAMEWIRGRSLYEWARVHNPTCREVLQVLAQVAWALEALHRGKCLHRDVKGDNILVELEGRALLTDFGSGTWEGAPPLTEWVMPPNTREYRSPESLRFEWSHWRTEGARYEARPADDLYALGVAVYRLVTGVYPPPGTNPEALKEQLEEPLPRRRPVQEFNERVVPELSGLIERMLAKDPEARGTARELAEAAESAAAHARPEAKVPFLDLEWLEAGTHALPVRNVPASKAPERVPVVDRDDSGAPSPEWLRVLVVAAVSLAVVGLCCMAPRPSLNSEPPEMAQAEAPDVEMAPDGGTRGLGEDALSARVDSQEVPPASESISLEVPKQPLPWQQRPPCPRSGEVIINGGCWRHVANIKPPCNHDEYEWQNACYIPVTKRTRPPTTKKPQ